MAFLPLATCNCARETISYWLVVLQEDIHIDMNIITAVLFQWLVLGENYLVYASEQLCDINFPRFMLGKVECFIVEDSTFALTP